MYTTDLKIFRKEKNMSQAQMAEIIGISPTGYAKIENGETKSITIEIAKRISKAINIHFNQLFEIEQPKQESDKVRELTDEYKKLFKELSIQEQISKLQDQVIVNWSKGAYEDVIAAFKHKVHEVSQITKDVNERNKEIDNLSAMAFDIIDRLKQRGFFSVEEVEMFHKEISQYLNPKLELPIK
jgi:transcriptional regulator with XRE-family HTH domain